MQIKVGKPMLINGNMHEVNDAIAELTVKLQKNCDKILLIDTTNSINPHNKAYRTMNQRQVLRNIYCVRVSNAYELWARLSTSEKFIRAHKIEALLINSISHAFEGYDKEEVLPVLGHIIGKIRNFTEKYNLITIIGNSCAHDENSRTVSEKLCMIG